MVIPTELLADLPSAVKVALTLDFPNGELSLTFNSNWNTFPDILVLFTKANTPSLLLVLKSDINALLKSHFPLTRLNTLES